MVSSAPIRRRRSDALRRLLPDATPRQRRLVAAAIAVIVLSPAAIGVTGTGPVKLRWGMYSNSDHHAAEVDAEAPEGGR